MAIVVVNEVEGGDQSFYERVTDQVMPGGQLPAGCKEHIAGPIDGGWRVITVWDSDDAFEKFRTETLVPTLQQVGEGGRVAPNITTNPVHRHLHA